MLSWLFIWGLKFASYLRVGGAESIGLLLKNLKPSKFFYYLTFKIRC